MSRWGLCLFWVLFTGSIAMSASALELQPGEIVIDGRTVASMQEAEAVMTDGSTIYLGPGVYSRGIHIKHDNVTLSGVDGTHFVDAAIANKGAIVVSGKDTLIENIRCSEITVQHGNGACIRHQGENLTVQGVHFHDSEQGVLENRNSGTLTIRYSRFERLGNKGQSHGIYSAGAELIVEHSQFVAMRKQGHSIKSRSEVTHISHSYFSSENGRDSRMVDIPNGGVLALTHSILHQTNDTVNRQVIGFGHEGVKSARQHAILVRDNLVVMERVNGNEFLAIGNRFDNKETVLDVTGNVLVGRIKDLDNWADNNTHYPDRSSAQLSINDLPSVANLESVLALLR